MMIERQCEVCGVPMILKRPNSSRKYCDACAKKVRMENQKNSTRTTKIEKKSRENKGAGQAWCIFKGAGYI